MNVSNIVERRQQHLSLVKHDAKEGYVDIGIATFVANFIMLEDILEFVIKSEEFDNPWGLEILSIKSLRKRFQQTMFRKENSDEVFSLMDVELSELTLTRDILTQVLTTLSHADIVIYHRIDRLEEIWKQYILDSDNNIHHKKVTRIQNNTRRYPLSMLYADKKWSITGKYFCLTIGESKH